MKKIFFVLAVSIILMSLCFTACNTGDANGMGTFSVRVGGGASRVMWNGYETDDFTYNITLSNGPGADQSVTIEPDAEIGTAHFTVEPGNWTIAVKASLDKELVAEGSERKNITAGKNGAIPITMRSPGGGDDSDPDDPDPVDTYDLEFNVANPNEWTTAVSEIKTKGANKSSLINIIGEVTINGNAQATFDITEGIDVTISGGGTLKIGGNGLLVINGNQSVTLKDANLQGTNNKFAIVIIRGTFTMDGGEIRDNISSASGVQVENTGTFIMSGGKISGNTSTFNGSGGGVTVMNGGTFTMSGGEISGNTINTGGNGGGVLVANGGTFTMKGGTISGNKITNGDGGGVAVLGTFRMINGTIYGSNETNTALQNTANTGAAALYLYTTTGTATYGSAPDGTSGGNLTTTNDTIRVVNGELQQ